jgi:hypothetical protein
MASIGGSSVTAWPSGNLATGAVRPEVETYIRDGVPDRGLVVSPNRGRPVDVTTITDVADASAATSLVTTFLNKVGTSVTVVDQFGITWADTQVLDSSSSYGAKATGGYRVTTAWSLLPTPP